MIALELVESQMKAWEQQVLEEEIEKRSRQ